MEPTGAAHPVLFQLASGGLQKIIAFSQNKLLSQTSQILNIDTFTAAWEAIMV